MIRQGIITCVFVISTCLAVFGQGSDIAIRFDGINDWVNLTNNTIDGTRTVEMWFKPDVDITAANATADALMGRDYLGQHPSQTDEFAIVFSQTTWGSAGKLEFVRYINNTKHSIYSDSDTWYADYWYHVAVVIDPVLGMRMYINGVLQGDTHTSTDSVHTQNGAQANLALGQWGNNGFFQWDGEIDEVRIWEDARTEAEIRDNMCQKLAGTEPDLKAYYTMDVNNNIFVDNVAGGGFDGTLSGGALRVTSGAPIGDTSVHLYSANYAGQSLALNFAVGDELLVDNITSTSAGFHIYRENSLPNTTNGMPSGAITSYYGVFFTDTTASYDVDLDYNSFTNNCSGCSAFYTRNDNAGTSWVPAGDSTVGCHTYDANESGHQYSRRAEYYMIPEIIINSELGNDTTLCDGDTLVLYATTDGGTYNWSDNSTIDSLVIWASGTYWVEVTVGNCVESDTIVVTFDTTPYIELGADTSICPFDSLILDATFPGATYNWLNFSSTNPMTTVLSPDTFLVEVTLGNCSFRDSIWVGHLFIPTVDIGDDTIVCEGSGLVLDAFVGNATFLWSNGVTTSTVMPDTTGLWSVDVLFAGACPLEDSVFVTVNPFPVVELGNDTTLCPGESIVLDATYQGATYVWQGLPNTTATLPVTSPGLYIVEVDLNGCTTLDAISVIYTADPNLDFGPDVSFCTGNTLTLDATTGGASYLWQDASANPTLNATTSGTYWAELEIAGCKFSDTISLTVNPFPIIDLGPDTTICPWDQLNLDATFDNTTTYLWLNNNSTSSTLAVDTAGIYRVELDRLGCTASDSIELFIHNLPTVELGNDTLLCTGENIVLDATNPGATYTWQDGSTAATYSPTISAEYSVTVNLNACPISDNVTVSFLPTPTVDLGPDIFGCDGDSAILDAFVPNAIYTWQDFTTDSALIARQSGAYYVEISFGFCRSTDTVNVTFADIPPANLGDDQSLCDGEQYVLDAFHPGSSYLWQDGSSLRNLVVQTAGLYTVTVTLGNCSASDEVFVDFLAIPSFELGNDTNICEGNTVTLEPNITGNDLQYIWQDGSSLNNFVASEPGKYRLTINRGNCTFWDSLRVSYTYLPVLGVNNDTTLCDEETVILQVVDSTEQNNVPVDFLWSTGSTSDAVLVTDPGQYKVEATNRCGTTKGRTIVQYEMCSCNIYAPTAFTPNSDNDNDFFFVESFCEFSEFEFTIFNRSGQRLFHTRDPGASWDGTFNGKRAPGGTYVWSLTYRALDNGKRSKKKDTGLITLLR